jgi:hypothetical protein
MGRLLRPFEERLEDQELVLEFTSNYMERSE